MEPLHTTKQKLISGFPISIVALGDSLTEGWMVPKGYCDFLVEMIKDQYPISSVTLINKGIPGDTAYGGLQRVDSDVLTIQPNLVLIQFGLNDAYQGYNLNSYKQNIQDLVHIITEKTQSEIILLTSSLLIEEQDRSHMDSFYNVLEEVAKTSNNALAATHKKWEQAMQNGIDHSTLLLQDRVHPSVNGHKLMARAVMDILI